jgi:hypothetical protein
MNIRKLLDWRKVLIYTHRWLGIVFGIIFVVWFVSGVVFMYVGMPSLSTSERLGHVPPLDLSTARVTPAEAVESFGLNPGRLSIEMYYDGRPIYRFGNTKIYADTGDLVEGADSEHAADLIRKWVPQYASTVRYDGYLEDSDQWTLQGAQRSLMPLHRISLGDPWATYYYVSEVTGEPVMKTDRVSRFWGWWSGVLHWTYFTAIRRHSLAWNRLVAWGSLLGTFMCLTGLAVGIWRLGWTRRYRLKGVRSHSPYAGWMWWHHYAGLLFGVVTCTWAFSGAMSLSPFSFVRSAPQTAAQRTAVPGDYEIDLRLLTLANLQKSIEEFAPSFTPKELDFLQFRGQPYLIGYEPPQEFAFENEVGSNAEADEPRRKSLMVSAVTPELGTFVRFGDERMWEVALAAMPGVPAQDAVWLQEYDAYYYSQEGLRPLPVLRVRYLDEAATWLYLDPHTGTMQRRDSMSRLNRWLFAGLHSLDFPWLYYQRPLWDIIVIGLSIGGIVLSATTLMPGFRRVARRFKALAGFVAGLIKPKRTPPARVSAD